MRKVISLSFSPAMADEIKKETKEHGYMSQSEFFRDIYRQWKENSFIPYLEEVPKNEITKEMREEANKARQLEKSELINI